MRILLIEDNELVQRALLRLIKSVHPYAATDVVDNAPEAIELLEKFAYDYIISDYDLKTGTGADVLRHVQAHFMFYIKHARFILMSGNLRPGITDLNHPLTFEKPIEPRKFRELLTKGLRP